MVGAVGIEPTTFGLKGRCSTTELRPCGVNLFILAWSLRRQGMASTLPAIYHSAARRKGQYTAHALTLCDEKEGPIRSPRSTTLRRERIADEGS